MENYRAIMPPILRQAAAYNVDLILISENKFCDLLKIDVRLWGGCTVDETQ